MPSAVCITNFLLIVEFLLQQIQLEVTCTFFMDVAGSQLPFISMQMYLVFMLHIYLVVDRDYHSGLEACIAGLVR